MKRRRREAPRRGPRQTRRERTIAPRRVVEEKALEWGRLLRAIERAGGPVTVPGLVRLLGLEISLEPVLRRQVEFLEAQGIVFAQRRGRYQMHGRARAVAGRLSVPKGTFGFVNLPGGATQDLFVPPSQMKGARHGDEVLARVVSTRDGGRGGSVEGAVVAVLDRAAAVIPGRFDAVRGVVIPRDERVARVILTGRADAVEDGAIVWVDIQRPEDRFNPAEGRIVEVAGAPDAPGVAERTVIRMLGIPDVFPEQVEQEARARGRAAAAAALEGREDHTGRCVFTIDPEDAKDHDDAVGIERIEGARGPITRLSVHIADVSHFVPEGSAMDHEAARRGVSVYMPGRCLPMLPELLSSTLCSLVPGEDRLVQSVILDFAEDARRLSFRLSDGIIRSRARLTYRAASGILAAGSRDEGEIPAALGAMKTLAAALRARRMRRGSLDLTTPDVAVQVDSAGRPVNVGPADRSESNDIIEEFMLAANEAVAFWFGDRGLPSLWRLHEEPDPRRILDLEQSLRILGVTMPRPNAPPVVRLKALLAQARGRPEEEAVGLMALRSLKLARYSHEPGAHFGLASSLYLHFTSPIRRYADLVVHRLLRNARREESSSAHRTKVSAEDLERLAGWGEECSSLSRRAEEAERAVTDWKVALWMGKQIGQQALGRITGRVTPGYLVTLEGSGVEGLIAVRGGRDEGRYRLGEQVRVRVLSVDPLRGRIALKPLSTG